MTISPRWYRPPSSKCFYHCVDTSVGGLLVRGGIVHPVIEALTTGWTVPPRTNSPPTEVLTQ
jgi:hypothetical protein